MPSTLLDNNNQQPPEFNEMEFPILGAKEMFSRRAEKGKRGAADRRHRREAAVRAVITKTIHDPEHLLGKRRMARLVSESSDGMAIAVPYSLNRKARWESASPDAILSADHPEGTDVDVVEAIVARDSSLATAVHCLNEDGTVTTARANGHSAKTSTLRENASKKRRSGRRSVRNSQNEPTESGTESEEDSASLRIEYTIQKTHPNPKAVARKAHRGMAREKTLRRAGAFRVDPDDIATASEMEASLYDDSNTYKPSRDFRFSLADYMQKPAGALEVVRRGSVEVAKEQNTSEDDIVKVSLGARPSDLVDISSAARTESFFESFDLCTAQWKEFNFSQQVDLLEAPLVVRWLDAERHRVAVDASPSLLSEREPFDRPLLVLVFERVRKNHLRVIINSLFIAPSDFSTSALRDRLSVDGAKGIAAIVDAVCDDVGQWKQKSPLAIHCSSAFSSRRPLFESSANSRLLSNKAHVIDLNKMADLLRKETELAVDEFERISADEWSVCSETEFEQFSGDEKAGLMKCVSCSCNDPCDLFEMDEWWQCRDCLRQAVLHQIRTKNVPFHIPLVVASGQSPFDLLPCLLPLPLVAFYTRIAAVEVLSDSKEAIGDLTECPGCGQVAHVERPNETNACRCSSCGVHWCVGCGFEPHWPMHCEKRKEWTQKFDRQYASETMREQIDKHIKRITCECGSIIEVGDLCPLAECVVCRLEFDPRSMTLTRTHFPYDSKTRKANSNGHLSKPFPFYHQSVELIVPTKLIGKQYAEICAWARTERLSEAKTNEFEKKMRKADLKEFERARELRRTVLHLLENGTAWLYGNKKETAVKNALSALQKQFEELCMEADRAKVPLAGRVEEVEAAVYKVVDALKTAIENGKHEQK